MIELVKNVVRNIYYLIVMNVIIKNKSKLTKK